MTNTLHKSAPRIHSPHRTYYVLTLVYIGLFIIIVDARSAAAIRDYGLLPANTTPTHSAPPSFALLAFFPRACTLPQKVERSEY